MWSCEECDGTGLAIWKGRGRELCHYCNGTGERDLTADEAVDILRDAGLPDYTWDYPFDVKWDNDKKEYSIFGGPLKNESYSGKTLTEALNAAARAVKERGKE